MTSKTYITIGIVALIVIAGIIYFTYSSQPEQKFPEIYPVKAEVDYSSNMKVNSIADVEVVFNKFITYSHDNNQEIWGHNPDPQFYRFKNATILGTYQGKKYWKVTSEWYGDTINPAVGKWMPEEVFDVSEDGEVVRLLSGT